MVREQILLVYRNFLAKKDIYALNRFVVQVDSTSFFNLNLLLTPTRYVTLFASGCKKKKELSKSFTPSCDRNGNFSANQCDMVTQSCYCVTELGFEIPESRIRLNESRTQNCDLKRLGIPAVSN